MCRSEAGIDEGIGRQELFGIKSRPAGQATFCSGHDKAILGALGNEPSFEVSDGPEDMKDQLSCGRRCSQPLLPGPAGAKLQFEDF